MARTVDDVLSKLDEIQAELDALRNQTISPRQIIVPGGISDLTDNLGIIRSGGLYALEKGSSPSDKEAIGVFVSATGEYFLGVPWAIGGVNKGVLMFGLDARTGRALFAGGRGVIDDEGISLQGLTAGITQEATITDEYDDEITRYGNLEMWLPDGSRTPVFGLVYKDDAVGDNFITNGNFEASQDELTGWTASAGESSYFGIALEGGPTRVGKVCMYSETRSSTQDGETLTAICNAAVTPERDYEFTFWTRDFYKETIIPVVSNVVIDESNPNFAWGSVANPASNAWLAAGYYSGQLTQKALLRFAVPSFLDVIEQVDRASWRFYVQKDGGLTLGSTTISMRRLIEDYEHTQVTYNKRNTSTSWTTAGASGSGTDREATAIGTLAVSAASTLEGYNDMPLTATKIQEWFDETNTDYSVVVEGSATSGNNAVDIGMIETEYGSFIEVIERSKYKVEAKWYTGAGGTGSLIRVDTLCRNNDVVSWNKRSIVLKAPTGAASFTLVITGYRGREFQFDDIEVKEIGIVSKLFLSPALSVQDNLGIRRVLTTKKELNAPSTPVARLAGDIQLHNQNNIRMGQTTSSTTYTQAHTTTNHGNRLLLVVTSGNLPVTGVTYNGVALTEYGTGTGLSYWYLLNPPVGTYNVVLSRGSSAAGTEGCATIFGFSGVKQDTPLKEYGTASSQTITVTVEIGEYAFSAIYDNDIGYNPYLTSAGTVSNSYNAHSHCAGHAYHKATVTSTTFVWDAAGNAPSISKAALNRDGSVEGDEEANVTDGDHYYVVTFYDESGETEASPVSNVVTNDSSLNKSLNGVTLPIGSIGTLGRKVYRTKANESSPFYYVATVANNTDTEYIDGLSDDDLGEGVPPLTNTTADRQQFPNMYYIPAVTLASNATLTFTATGVAILVSTSAANANNRDYFKTSFWMSSGIYDIILHCRVETTAGKIDVYIDDVLVTSSPIDLYAGSGAIGSSTIEDVVIDGSGYHTLRIVVNGKHASSSDYTFGCYGIYFVLASGDY